MIIDFLSTCLKTIYEIIKNRDKQKLKNKISKKKEFYLITSLFNNDIVLKTFILTYKLLKFNMIIILKLDYITEFSYNI